MKKSIRKKLKRIVHHHLGRRTVAKARRLLSKGKKKEAKQVLDRYVKKVEVMGKPLLEAAAIYMQLELYIEAVECAEMAIKIDPKWRKELHKISKLKEIPHVMNRYHKLMK